MNYTNESWNNSIRFPRMNKLKAIRSWKLIFQIDTCRSPFQKRGLRYHRACSYSTKRRGTGGGCSGDIERSQGVRATRRRDFMGESGVAVAEAIKKLGARFQDRTGQDVFCQKLGSGATAPGCLEPMALPVSVNSN